MRKTLIIATNIAAFAFFMTVANAQEYSDDEIGVRQAARDYIHAFYDGDPSLGERGVSEILAKRGFARRSVEDDYTGPLHMSYEELLELASEYSAPEGSPENIIIFEISDVTASVKVEAEWGFDYLHLAKFDGRWKIVNVLWQTYPDLEGPE